MTGIENIKSINRNFFLKAREVYRKMHSEGKHKQNLVEGDIVTAIDTEITRVAQEYFTNLDQNYLIESEELAKSDEITESGEYNYTVIIDEIDGTHNMRDETGAYGPIIAIAEGLNPTFNDVICAGYMNLSKNIFYEAYRSKGAYKTNLDTEESESIQTSGRTSLEGEEVLALLLDQAMLGKEPKIAEEAWQYWCNDFGSMGQHFALVSEGVRDGFISGGHGYIKDKNTAEELAGMYLLVKESEGCTMNWNGTEIGSRKIGMKDGKNHDIVAAATRELAEEIVEDILPK